jgi:hypothetical protein
MTGAEIVVDGGWLLESGEYTDKLVLIISLLRISDHSP